MEHKFDASPENHDQDSLSEIINRLIKLRDDYSDAIPKDDMSAGPFKVRHAWFQSLLLDIGEVLELHENHMITLSPDLVETLDRFTQYITSDIFKARPTTPEDLSSANTVLDQIINQLK